MNQTGFPGTNVLPVAIVTTNETVATNCVDYRPDWFLTGGSAGGGGGSNIAASLTLSNLSGNNSGNILNSAVSGMYAVYVDVIVTTPSASGTLQITVSWNNGVLPASMQTAQIDLTQQGETAGLLGNFFSGNGQPVSYNAVATNDDGTERYQLAFRLVYMG